MLWKNFHTLSNSDPPILQPRKKGLRAQPEISSRMPGYLLLPGLIT
jgi:hypothetical protein